MAVFMSMSVILMVGRIRLLPTIELARHIGLSSSRINEAERLVKSRQQEIINAWNNHLGS
ncbi:MAG: hypothetical protein VKI42_08005 [Synechococcaceae cyanobacterium]|nr:hypothetical protein [Synechococcaceae cyanobacterium]